MKKFLNKFPAWGWAGLGLILIFWPLNWLGPEGITRWGFFPLWLGYCLTVDGLVYLRKGSSLASRSWSKYAVLFLLSVPLWWTFEALNLRLENWQYLGRETFSDLEYALLASLSFSTVIPAVLGSAELIGSLEVLRPLKNLWVFQPGRKAELLVFAAGWVSLGAVLAWPRYFYPLVWLAVYFILEPVNRWLGFPTLVDWTERGDWRPFGALFLGVLLTGFFWEMWNYFSFPKWVYSVPFVGFWKIFEMPLLGYGGYLPFSLEIYAFTRLAFGLLGWDLQSYYPLVKDSRDSARASSRASRSEA